MHLKLTVQRPEGRRTDIAVTIDATALVGDLATALYTADPARAGMAVPDGLTLQVDPQRSRGGNTSSGRVLDPGQNLVEAGVRSGSLVTLLRGRERPSTATAAEQRGPAVALLRVLGGPDAGAEFPLPAGVSHIGRMPGSEVRLSDPLVSKRHARVLVGESVEIIDAQSANGLVLGGLRVQRAAVGPADTVLIGDTTVSIVQTQRPGTVAPESSAIEFNRSPRVVPRFPVQKLRAPEPPRKPEPAHLPLIGMLAPMLMGVVLFAVTRSALSILFIFLAPLMMLGMYFDQQRQARKQLRDAGLQFQLSLRALVERLTRLHADERQARHAEAPSVAEALDAAHRLGGLLWTHRPEHSAFLTVRLGVGAAPSRCEVELPERNETLPQYWEELLQLQAGYSTVTEVPVVADFRSSGAVGVAGSRGLVEGVARGIVMQLACLHSPAELVLAALASPVSRAGWEWLEWLPHVGSVHSPIGGAHLADNAATGQALLATLEELLAQRRAAGGDEHGRGGPGGFLAVEQDAQPGVEKPRPVVPSVVVLVEDDCPVDRARLTRVAELGPAVGVYVLWVAAAQESLPAVCRTFLTVAAGGATLVTGHAQLGRTTVPVASESLDPAVAKDVAVMLAPVVDVGAAAEDSSDLPRSVSYLDLAGHELAADPAVVVERWRESESLTVRDGSPPVRRSRNCTLRALVGSAGVEPMYLDLREHGPHALVGGTTGAGKSEFLQSWVLGMAAAHSPDRLAFLFVDYKGGAAFADCVQLPHTVGLVTDLSPHLVRRALTSLRAELHHRELLLNKKKAKDLVSLERAGDPDAPPSLVIIVDEFAALVTEVPEFVDGVVDVAQRGRSLGLHLVLATQRPAGVIRDNLRANTTLRIALRMADEDDSADVLGVKDAAHFPTSIPGRAAAKTGPGRITRFQAAYAGGWTTQGRGDLPVEITEMRFGTGDSWEAPLPVGEPEAELGPTDIARTVATITAAARQAQVPAPRKPWLPELATTYNLAKLPNPRTDALLLLGVRDDPARQDQPTVFFEPDRDGNMAILGTGGSGKSSALRTIAVAAAVTVRGGPVRVYCLDFGSNGLRPLEGLPHVGAVVRGEDEERLGRVMRLLRDTVAERSARYSAAQADTIVEYRARAGTPDEPRLLLLVDGIGAFREAFEHSVAAPWFTLLTQVATDGRPVGVHVVVAGDRPNSVPPSLGSTIQRRLVLRLASEDDYVMLGVPKDVLSPASPPGRGIIGKDEVQLAVLGGNANVAVQARELAKLSDTMLRHGATRAPGIGSLPDSVALGALPERVGGLPVIGVDDANLAPIGVEPRGTLMVAGPTGGGRTTALATIAQALKRARRAVRLFHFSPRGSTLAALGLWAESAQGAGNAAALAERLVEAVESGRFGPGDIAVVIEGLADFDSGPADTALGNLVRAATAAEQFVVAEAESSAWSKAWSLAPPFKAGRKGLLLTPSDMDGDTLLDTPLGRVKRAEFPPGRGFLVAGGKAVKLQVALPQV